MRKTLVLICMAGGLLLEGCNAGLGVLLGVLLSDDDGGHKKKRDADTLATVEFVALEKGRLRPAESVIVIHLRDSSELPAKLSVDFATAGGVFQPAAISAPPGAVIKSPGLITKLRTSTGGMTHRIPWNAVHDLGGDSFQKVLLQFTGDIEGPLVVEVSVGNDAPTLSGLTVSQREGEDVAIGVLVADSSEDPVDVVVEFATEEDGNGTRLFQPSRSLSGHLAIPSKPEGEGHAISWGAPADAGAFDRVVVLKLTPLDRIEGVEGKTGESIEHVFALNNNHAPEVEILESEFLTDPDQRGNIAVPLRVQDVEGNPVDAIVQWAAEGEEFLALDPSLDTDTGARQTLLRDEEARGRLHIADFASDILEGPVELSSLPEPLVPDEVLASWIKAQGELRGLSPSADGSADGSSPLIGRRVTLLPANGGLSQVRTICGYTADRGVIKLEEPFDPAPAAGSRLQIDLGGSDASLRLASSASGLRRHLIWRSSTMLPGGGAIRFRVTPFDRVSAEAAGCAARPGSEAPGIVPGSRGLPFASGGSKPLHGPFGVDDSMVTPLAPLDDPVALAALDVDSDGRVDTVVVARSSNVVLVLLQKSPGVFDTQRLSDSRLKDPSGLVARDLDGDGDVDMAISDQKSGKILIMYQEPDLDFISNRAVLSASGALKRPVAITSADFDADGDVDLAVAEAEGEDRGVRVFFRGGGPSGCSGLQAGYSSCVLQDSNSVNLMPLWRQG